MSKMSSHFLALQEAGEIPTDPEDYYEHFNRKKCSGTEAKQAPEPTTERYVCRRLLRAADEARRLQDDSSS